MAHLPPIGVPGEPERPQTPKTPTPRAVSPSAAAISTAGAAAAAAAASSSAAAEPLSGQQFSVLLVEAGLPDTPDDLRALHERASALNAKMEALPNKGPGSSQIKEMMHSAYQTLAWAWKGAVAPALAVLAYMAVDVPIKTIIFGAATVALTVIALTKLFIMVASCLIKHDTWAKASETLGFAAATTIFVTAMELNPRSSQAELKAYRELFSGTPVQEVIKRFAKAKRQIATSMLAGLGIEMEPTPQRAAGRGRLR